MVVKCIFQRNSAAPGLLLIIPLNSKNSQDFLRQIRTGTSQFFSHLTSSQITLASYRPRRKFCKTSLLQFRIRPFFFQIDKPENTWFWSHYDTQAPSDWLWSFDLLDLLLPRTDKTPLHKIGLWTTKNCLRWRVPSDSERSNAEKKTFSIKKKIVKK